MTTDQKKIINELLLEVWKRFFTLHKSYIADQMLMLG